MFCFSWIRNKAKALRCITLAFDVMYKADYWLTAEECDLVGKAGMNYLRCYKQLAVYSRQQGFGWFPLYAKNHMMHHQFQTVLEHGRKHGFAANPIASSVQMDEDAVGKTSRLSRRVSPKTPALSTIGRYLIGVRQVWKKAN